MLIKCYFAKKAIKADTIAAAAVINAVRYFQVTVVFKLLFSDMFLINTSMPENLVSIQPSSRPNLLSSFWCIESNLRLFSLDK